ncbi:MAG TPA: hypothetical protein VL475_06775 [Planctomycetaceae bacterium]|jgi:RimJ/RimL family protein N-acetyltransferase|nr:hypothetical protein [Planctomycetaceae bacterium]
MVIVETERLILRHFHTDDGDAMDQFFGDVEVMHFGRGVRSPHWVREWLRNRLEYYQTRGFAAQPVPGISGGVRDGSQGR